MTEQVTIFQNIYEKDNPFYKSVEFCLNRIKNGSSKEAINKLRSGEKQHKKTLPVVLWSGTFTSRKDDAIVEHNGFIVLDFDNVDTIFKR